MKNKKTALLAITMAIAVLACLPIAEIKAQTFGDSPNKSDEEWKKMKRDAGLNENSNSMPIYSTAWGARRFKEKAEKLIVERIPLFVLPKENATSAIRVLMNKDGSVIDVYIRRSSGDSRLDSAIIDATYEAGPFGQVPWQLSKEVETRGVIVDLHFNSSDKK